MPTLCVIYARFSPRPDAPESESNQKQEARCREYATGKGYTVVEVYEDQALTGMDDEEDPDPAQATLNRPGLLAAIEAIKPGMVLLVRWRSRIARDPYVQAWARRKVLKRGGRIEAADESNERGLAGELLENTLATVDKYRVIRIRIDTALAMKRHQAAGRRMTRKEYCPWGWMPDPKDRARLVRCGAEEEISHFVRSCRENGFLLREIAKDLEQIGFKRRGKGTWDVSAVRRVLNANLAGEG